MTVALLATANLWAGQWTALGPDGGDVRSLSQDPRNPDHIFLGTSTGTIFDSQDGGRNWSRFAHLGSGDDYVLDHIAIDSKNPDRIYVAAWSVENQQSGDLFKSTNGGKSWEPLDGMHGKSIRAMAIADSDHDVLVTGALDGVYRSNDSGKTWQKISASMQSEIKNVESIAVDPKNPNTVYAGTWHLAWKTSDGGATWQHINKGMIDDSDVFSIIVDYSNPSVVFASACSGIYRSANGGELFQKIQGIPFSARRTRVLKQDPSNPNTVYAGTTEGLWRTLDSGKTWKRVSNPEVVVNDVQVDPRNSSRVLLATDRSGVLSSDDGTQTFVASNHGYTHRYVTAIVADNTNPNTILVGVVNDREWGGVFASQDGGQHWTQKSAGLGGRDVFSLEQASNGALLAGTNRGIFMLEKNSNIWKPINTIVTEKVSTRVVKKGSKKTSVATKTAVRSVLDAKVNDIEATPKAWFAATSSGLFTSTNKGQSWTGGPVMGKTDFVAVQSSDKMIAVATRTNVLVSSDDGATWKQGSLASYVTSIRNLTITPDAQILVASREGAFRSSDAGTSWEHMVNGLPDKNISSISYDSKRKQLLATSTAAGVVFHSSNNGTSWHRGSDTGYPMRRISVVNGRYMAATPFDGVIVQPDHEMESASAESGSN
ncbi:MAG TPA: transcriptional regulator [Terriglobales bacterium]|jgi:photosystem II stability/assembly factor-like uncharacterized protein